MKASTHAPAQAQKNNADQKGPGVTPPAYQLKAQLPPAPPPNGAPSAPGDEGNAQGPDALQMARPEDKSLEETGTSQLKPAVVQTKSHNDGCGCNSCSTQLKEDPVQRQAGIMQFARPSYITAHTFLGIQIPRSRGLHPNMATALTRVDTELQSQYNALDPSAPDHPATLANYAGIYSIKGWRETTSAHGTGSAVDVNYEEQPYIATRTEEGGRTTYGGEQGGATRATRALRRPATEVYDRAVAFMRTNPYDEPTADVGNRREGETATATYQRFASTSDALKDYLGLAFAQTDTRINRRTVADPEGIAEADLLAAIPTTERFDETVAVANIQALMDDQFWQILHPGYALSARDQYIRILRDYEIVRAPMQYGNPAERPTETRNPARGFLHMPEHFVVAMMDVGGLRWGACEFSGRSNGDVHHFDLRTPHHTAAPAPSPTEATADPLPGEAVAQPKANQNATPSPNAGGNGNSTGLPDDLKTNMESMSGISLDDVNVNLNSDKPSEMQAHAYAQGTDIHIAPGQEKHLPHEAWHVVQQKQGRVTPTTSVGGNPVNDNPGLESEADNMGAKALQMKAEAPEKEPEKMSSQAIVAQHKANDSGCGCSDCTAQLQAVSLRTPVAQREVAPATTTATPETETPIVGDSLEGIQHMTLQDIAILFAMDIESREFSLDNGTTVIFTQAWVNRAAGMAIIRGEYRPRIQMMVSGGFADQVRAWINGAGGQDDRRQEMLDNVTVAEGRVQARTGAAAGTEVRDETESSPALIEEAINSGQSFKARGYNYTRFGGPNTNQIQWEVNNWEEALALEPRLRAIMRSRYGLSDARINDLHRQRLRSGPGRNRYNSHLIRLHAAWDINGPTDSGVYAPISGTVVEVRQAAPGTPANPGYGNFVRIRHDSVPYPTTVGAEADPDAPQTEDPSRPASVYTSYCHLNETLVAVNSRIHSGQAIGLMGHSGLPGGTHLHFSVHAANATTSESEVASSINPETWWRTVTGGTDPYVQRVTRAESTSLSQHRTRDRIRERRREEAAERRRRRSERGGSR